MVEGEKIASQDIKSVHDEGNQKIRQNVVKFIPVNIGDAPFRIGFKNKRCVIEYDKNGERRSYRVETVIAVLRGMGAGGIDEFIADNK